MTRKMNAADDVKSHVQTYCQQLTKGMLELQTNQLLCDVVLTANGGVQIKAHRVVLAGSSPYFRAMFTGNLAEKEMKEVEIQTVDPDILKTVVEYVYSGCVNITPGNVQSLLSAADLLQLDTLLQECCNFLEHELHPSNCIGITKFAEIHACYELYEKSFSFLLKNFTDVLQYEEYLELSDDFVCEILNHNELRVPSEETVLRAAEIWIENDPKIRKHLLQDLLQCVRLAQLPIKTLHKCIEAHPHILEDFICQKIIQDALQYKLSASNRLSKVWQKCVSVKPRRAPRIICAVGGKNGLFETLNSLEVYLAESGTWTDVTPMSVRRYECGAVAHRNNLYVLGGMVTETRENASFHYHDNQAEYWTLKTNTWHSISPMMQRRSALAVVVMQGYIYALGGYDGESYLRSVERYCPKLDRWEQVRSLKFPRSCFSAVVLDGFLFAVGGYSPPCLNSVEKYDCINDRWDLVTAMNEKRMSPGVGAACGFLYAVGGHNGSIHLSSTERYDPVTDQWSLVTSLGIPRTGLGVAVLDNYLYAVGGHSGTAYMNCVQRYDPYEDKWENVDNMLAARCSFGIAAL